MSGASASQGRVTAREGMETVIQKMRDAYAPCWTSERRGAALMFEGGAGREDRGRGGCVERRDESRKGEEEDGPWARQNKIARDTHPQQTETSVAWASIAEVREVTEMIYC